MRPCQKLLNKYSWVNELNNLNPILNEILIENKFEEVKEEGIK
jgi:hypothetical protein